VPRKTIFKIGLATGGAAVAAILAITSAFAHGTPTTTGRSMVGTIVNAATGATLVSFQDSAQNALTVEQTTDAIEAADLAAKIAAEQAALAAKLAALAAEEAAEAPPAPPTACQAADKIEDTNEKAADLQEDANEKAGTVVESAIEDANEKTSAQAAETAEGTEVKCPSTNSEGTSTKPEERSTSSSGSHD
jgi:hypothetical protein